MFNYILVLKVMNPVSQVLAPQHKQTDKNNIFFSIFLDFKRSFETIDRKIHAYGIEDIELKWFESYLTNMKQITKVHDIKSHIYNNEYGVPQGSILGALLMVLYINDMPNTLNKCEIVLRKGNQTFKRQAIF